MRQRGFSLIEILMVVALAGVLLAIGLSSFNNVLATNRTRAVTENIMAGLQLARSEAIRRNAPMRFHLVSTLANGCADSTSSQLWVVTQSDQNGKGLVTTNALCGSSPWVPPDQPDPCSPDHGQTTCALTPVPAGGCFPRPTGNPAACSADPWVAFKSPASSLSDITVSAKVSSAGAAASIVTFGPLGQILPNQTDASNTMAYLTISHASNANAKTWAIRIGANGSIKMCDPSVTSTAPMSCS